VEVIGCLPAWVEVIGCLPAWVEVIGFLPAKLCRKGTNGRKKKKYVKSVSEKRYDIKMALSLNRPVYLFCCCVSDVKRPVLLIF